MTLEEIKKVMLDPGLRAAEAAEAKKIREAKRKDLDDKLALLTTHGEELSDKDLKTVMKSFGNLGFTEADIRKRFREIVGKKTSEKVDLTAVIDKTQAKNIQTGLASVDLPEGTLYDFLELPALREGRRHEEEDPGEGGQDLRGQRGPVPLRIVRHGVQG